MANQPDKSKTKYTYFEQKDVFADLHIMASDETKKRGHVVTVPELIRELTLKRVNTFRAKHGQKSIDYDTSAGKFAPGGAVSAVQATVDIEGRMVVVDRKGNRLMEWKKVEDVPNLLRLYPRCKILYTSRA